MHTNFSAYITEQFTIIDKMTTGEFAFSTSFPRLSRTMLHAWLSSRFFWNSLPALSTWKERAVL